MLNERIRMDEFWVEHMNKCEMVIQVRLYCSSVVDIGRVCVYLCESRIVFCAPFISTYTNMSSEGKKSMINVGWSVVSNVSIRIWKFFLQTYLLQHMIHGNVKWTKLTHRQATLWIMVIHLVRSKLHFHFILYVNGILAFLLPHSLEFIGIESIL